MRRTILGGIGLTLMAANVSFAIAVSFNNVAGGVWSSGFAPVNIVLTPSAGGTLNAQMEPHFALIRLPTGCSGVTCQESNISGDLFGPTSYLVLGGNGVFPLDGTWVVQDNASSSWIGPRADQRNPAIGGSTYDNTNVFASDADFYVYRMVFNLSLLGLNPATAGINLSWLSDSKSNSTASEFSHIRLCSITSASDSVCPANTQIANSRNSGQGASSLSSVNITTGFSAGLMALDFVVYNAVIGSGRNPSGLNVSINSAIANTAATLADADLQISKTDGVSLVSAGSTTVYTIVVTNAGPGTATSAPVNDILPPQIVNASWTCTPSAGSSCVAISGTGNIATLVNLLPAGTATFAVTATLAPLTTGTVTNTTSVGAAPGATDPTLANNSATDIDAINIAGTFTDDPLISGTTLIQAVHVLELRARIDAVRTAHGLLGYFWVRTVTPTSTTIMAQDVAELRTALDQAYDQMQRAHYGYTRTIVAGQTIQAQDVSDTRAALVAIE